MADKEFLNRTGLSHLWNKIKTYVGRKTSVGTPVPVTTAADFVDESGLYLYLGSESGYDAGYLYYWNGSAWAKGSQYNEAPIRVDDTLNVEGDAADAHATGTALAGKVDKISGKGLSTEDYTTAEKEKLASLSELGLSVVNGAINVTYIES